jgi:hypothetical protein
MHHGAGPHPTNRLGGAVLLRGPARGCRRASFISDGLPGVTTHAGRSFIAASSQQRPLQSGAPHSTG